MSEVRFFFDYKSPYSYLALDGVYSLQAKHQTRIDWVPFVLDIPAALGSLESRTPLQWDKVKNGYADVRRWANKRGLIIRGPQKIFDSSLAAKGFYFVRDGGGDEKRYHQQVFQRFFQRELDIENVAALSDVIKECDVSPVDFEQFAAAAGEAKLQADYAAARALGVFGVPSFAYDGELFWGNDRLHFLEERIEASRLNAKG